jgi:hypothetical protein
MLRALLLMVCLIGVVVIGGVTGGCADGGSTLPDVGPGELKIDASATRTIGYGYLSTSFFVNIAGGRQPYLVTWDFGDNSDPKIGDRVSHLYEVPGQYTASCTVHDSDDPDTGYIGAVATDFVEITIFFSGV